MRELERRVVLSVLDRKWREHLYEMDYLQEGIGLRAMAQRDPLVEYQREGYDLFAAMMDAIKEESVGYLFHLEVQVEDPAAAAAAAESAGAPVDAEGAEAVLGAIAGGSLRQPPPEAPATPVPPVLLAKGLDVARPTRMEYSAPSLDGEAGVVHRSEDGAAGVDGDDGEIDPNASRAERRRQARAQRKSR